MPPFSNRMRRTLAKLEAVPSPLRDAARTFAIGRTIRYVGTSGVKIEEAGDLGVTVSVPNAGRVQNHIGGIHAAALALAAETATGLTVGMNVHDGAVPVLKSMRVDYLRRAQGGVRAAATLTPEQADRLRTEARGNLTVPVSVTDESGAQPVACVMEWAWTPRR